MLSGLIALELRRHLGGRRGLPMALLALLPALILLLLRLITVHAGAAASSLLADPNRARDIFAGLYDGLIARTVIFFGCAWLFLGLARGDQAQRSLHYQLLAPMPRWAFLLGKYCAGAIIAAVLFVGAIIPALWLANWPHAAAADFSAAPGLTTALAYLGLALLACLAYGAVFTLLGLLGGQPAVWVLALWGWEWINFLLPPVLQRLSVIHYVKALAPVPVAGRDFTILAPPVPGWEAVLILLGIAAGFVALAARRAASLEISYGAED